MRQGCDERGPVYGDLLDHLCCLIEERMDDGMPFEEALREACGELPLREIELTEFSTQKLLHMKTRMFPRRLICLLLVPFATAFVAVFATRNMPLSFEVEASIHAGVPADSIPGVNADEMVAMAHTSAVLRPVAMRLYALNMIHGNPDRDNNYITAEHFRQLQAITPAEVEALIDTASEERTVDNLLAYEQPDSPNFVYGLTRWNHEHYSFKALNNIKISHMPGSGMIRIKYTNNDPGITYNTMSLFIDELMRRYAETALRQCNTDAWRERLDDSAAQLREAEKARSGDAERLRMIHVSDMEAYGKAVARQRALQMSLAAVQVLDQPTFPIAALPTNRKQIVQGWFFGSLAATLALMGLLTWHYRRRH